MILLCNKSQPATVANLNMNIISILERISKNFTMEIFWIYLMSTCHCCYTVIFEKTYTLSKINWSI